MNKHSERQPFMRCSACGAEGKVAASKEITHTLRRIYYRCDEAACGQTWEANLSYTRTLSPSAFGPVDPVRRRKIIRPPDPDDTRP
ncbi:MAG: ogr/Delta-like zinc finger family protein [Asticcacaulis sp.]